MPDDPSRGFASGLRRRARRVWYRVQDVGSTLVAAPLWAGSKLRDAWMRLPAAARQRLAIAAGVLAGVALLLLVAVPALPCQFPGGDRCAPSDDAIELVPGDALLYVHANTDPDSEQYERAAELGGRLPTLTSQALANLPGAAGAGIDYPRDVRPWLGGEAAVALLPADRDRIEQALILEIDDDAGAERFVDDLVGRSTRSKDYKEVAVTARGDVSTAVVDGFLVLGPESAVRLVIDTTAGDENPLGDSDAVAELDDELPEDALVRAFVSERGAADLFRAGAPLGSLETFVNSDVTEGAAATLVADGDGLEVETHSLLDPDRVSASPGFFGAFTQFEPDLAAELSSDSLLYLGLGDPAQSATALLAQASAEAPGLTAGFERFAEQLRKDGDVNLEREVLPLLDGEIAVGIEPPPKSGEGGGEEQEGESLPEGIEPGGPAPLPAEPGELSFTGVPYVVFVADDVDEEQARNVLADLQVPIARALDPEEGGQAPVFEGAEIEGLQARSLRISATVNLTYAIFDEKLVVATDPAGIEQVKSGEGSLDDADRYHSATEGFPGELSALLFLNVGDLIALAERQGLAEDPAYALFANEVRKLDALGLGVDRDDTGIESRLRLTVEE